MPAGFLMCPSAEPHSSTDEGLHLIILLNDHGAEVHHDDHEVSCLPPVALVDSTYIPFFASSLLLLGGLNCGRDVNAPLTPSL